MGVRCGTLLGACIVLASCGGDTDKVKFSEKKYGVTASPRIVSGTKPVPKGGGRSVVGKPYKVAGKWYYPKDDPKYKAVGLASWYGPTFHGRMTANGEIFDRNGLTAAHTTMPLPSYARVTNTNNGKSMVVRVNDRGPFHGNRVIDLSERVASLLETRQSGVAKVKVEYLGRAPLHGRDEKYLLASFSGKGSSAPGTSRPDTMLAFAQPKQVPNLAIIGRAPVPISRPYDVYTTASVVSVSHTSAALGSLDPALVYNRQKSTITVATSNSFNDQIGSILNQIDHRDSLRPVTVKPSYSVNGAAQQGSLGVLPVPAPQAYSLQRGSAVSSYAAVSRISSAHEVFKDFSSGVGLKSLAVASAEN